MIQWACFFSLPQSKEHLLLCYMVDPASYSNNFLKALERAFEKIRSKILFHNLGIQFKSALCQGKMSFTWTNTSLLSSYLILSSVGKTIFGRSMGQRLMAGQMFIVPDLRAECETYNFILKRNILLTETKSRSFHVSKTNKDRMRNVIFFEDFNK